MKQKLTLVLFLIAISSVMFFVSPFSPFSPYSPQEVLALSPAPQSLKRVADFYFDVGADDVRNYGHVNKFGNNGDVDQAEEDIWDGGGVWDEPTASQVYTFTSTSGDDASPDGTGARTIEIFGLDSDGLLASETLALTGTGEVTATNQYSMMHRLIVRTAGSGGENAGTITANANTDGTVTAQITIGNNQTLMAIYKVSAIDNGCLIGFYVGMNRASPNNGLVDIFLKVKPPGEVWQVKQVNGLMATGTTAFQHIYNPPKCFDPLTIIKMSAIGQTDSNDISAGFDLVLHPN